MKMLTPGPWKCVKPYNKHNATTQDRINSSSENAPAMKGYEKKWRKLSSLYRNNV